MLLEERLENEVISNLTAFLILKCVEVHGGKSYGYEMQKFIEKFTGKSISAGTLYPLLSKLGNRDRYGYLVSSRENTESNRTRIYYSFTDKGRELLESWPQKWSYLKTFTDDVLEQLQDTRI